MSTLSAADADHWSQATAAQLPARIRTPWLFPAPVPPARDESRDETTASGPLCLECGGPVVRAATGRPKLYCDECGQAARQRAHRARKAGRTA
jgi:predicted RNA-binding Zn-ribbon protein involved in translation (DUF1610 family)